MAAIRDGDSVHKVDFGDDSLEVYWTPDANEQALTVVIYSDETDEEMMRKWFDMPIQDARAMAFAVLDATGGRTE